MPLLEALASGTPSLVSDIPAFREIGSPDVRYFAPHEAGQIAEALDWAAGLSDGERQRLRDSQQCHARRYTWEVAARRTIAMLEEVAGAA